MLLLICLHTQNLLELFLSCIDILKELFNPREVTESRKYLPAVNKQADLHTIILPFLQGVDLHALEHFFGNFFA